MPDFKLHPIDISIVGIYIVFVVWFGFRIGKKHKSEKKKKNNIPVSKVLTSILEKYDQNQPEIKN